MSTHTGVVSLFTKEIVKSLKANLLQVLEKRNTAHTNNNQRLFAHFCVIYTTPLTQQMEVNDHQPRFCNQWLFQSSLGKVNILMEGYHSIFEYNRDLPRVF